MKRLRIIRIILAIAFLTLSVITLCLGASAPRFTKMVLYTQILPSAFASSAGAILLWLGLTLIFGRVYCSTVCPIGTLTELINKLSRLIPCLNKPFAFRRQATFSKHIIIIYLLTLIAGVTGVAYFIEPWNIMRNLAAWVNPSAVDTTWITIGLSALFGGICGIIAIIPVLALALMDGRRFCTTICPVGTALGMVGNYSMYHIEINPDTCTACGLCEEICPSRCIKVVSRYVDDSRCIRCLDCIAKCPEKAINLQINRNRPATPLFTRVKTHSKS